MTPQIIIFYSVEYDVLQGAAEFDQEIPEGDNRVREDEKLP